MPIGLSPDSAMRKKHGIRPKKGGPGAAYGLPLPPKAHPLAATYAKRVLSRAKATLDGGRFHKADVIKQVRKANDILYGSPAPTSKQKADARKKRAERDAAYYFGESIRESLYGIAPDGSWEQQRSSLENAVQASKDFGGPVVPYGTDSENAEVLRPGDLGIAASYPAESKILVANWRTGDYWSVPYTIGEDGKSVTLGEAKPAEIEVTARTKEALRSLRESGVANARMYPIHVGIVIREASQIKDDGTVEVMAVRMGPGNPTDKNYYDESFIESIVPLLDGAPSFFNHPSLFDEKNLPERSVLDMAGWFSDARKGEWTDPQGDGTAVPAAFAIFHPVEGDSRATNLLRTCRNKFQKYPEKEPFVGYSMHAFGVGAPGDQNGESYNILSRCTQLMSADMVTTAGAGGRPIITESNMPKGRRGAPATRTAREASTRIDPALGVDIRTDAERAAEAQLFVRETTRAAVTDLLSGPMRAAILKEAGVADPGAGKDFTDDDVDKIAAKTGMVKGGKLHQAVSDALTNTNDDEVEETEEGTEPGTQAPATVVGSMTQTDVDALSDEQRTLLLKAGVQLGESGRGGSTAATIALAKENEKLKTQLAEANRKSSQEDFRKVFEAACDKFKNFSEPHRILCERLVAGATSNDEIAKGVRAYYDAHIVEGAKHGGSANGDRTARESGVAVKAPNYIKAGR